MTPSVKKQNLNTDYYYVVFLQIIFHNTSLYSISTNKHDFFLGTFEYIEADREIYRKCITKCIHYSKTLHVWFSDYFTYIIIICRSKTFTPGIVCTTFCCALPTQIYCTYYRCVCFSCPLIWDKCSISCSVLNDTGWCLELVRVPVNCCICEWPVFTSCGVCCTSKFWRVCGMIKTRTSSFKKICRFSFLRSPMLGTFSVKITNELKAALSIIP